MDAIERRSGNHEQRSYHRRSARHGDGAGGLCESNALRAARRRRRVRHQQNLSASTQVTITSAPSSGAPAISWSAPAAIAYGTALSSAQLNVTANVPGTFVYTPAAGVVLKAGTQTLSAVFTPTASSTYSSATATVQLTVNQANPTITWAAPAAITEGTALSATQLDATANVPGTFCTTRRRAPL